ncbi:MAG: hypothetical protein AAFW95_02070 [Cyanobacteria bacterium J06638_6]
MGPLEQVSDYKTHGEVAARAQGLHPYLGVCRNQKFPQVSRMSIPGVRENGTSPVTKRAWSGGQSLGATQRILLTHRV